MVIQGSGLGDSGIACIVLTFEQMIMRNFGKSIFLNYGNNWLRQESWINAKIMYENLMSKRLFILPLKISPFN